MKINILKNKRVSLRPINISDAPNYVKWFKHKRVMEYVGQQYYNISLAEERKAIRKMIKNDDQYTFAVHNEEQEHIGSVGVVVDKINKSARFGILIGDQKQWGKGYAGECIALILHLVFKKLKLNRIDLSVFKPNKNAIKAYTKAGFKKEGVLRQARYNKFKKRFEDEVVMSILKNEYLKLNKLLK